jgi:hypothetical protein
MNQDTQYGPVGLKFIRMTSGEDLISEYQTVDDKGDE